MSTIADTITTIQGLIAEEQTALDAAQSADERAEHEECLAHYNRTLTVLTDVQNSGANEEEQAYLLDFVTIGAAVGLFEDDEAVSSFKETVLDTLTTV